MCQQTYFLFQGYTAFCRWCSYGRRIIDRRDGSRQIFFDLGISTKRSIILLGLIWVASQRPFKAVLSYWLQKVAIKLCAHNTRFAACLMSVIAQPEAGPLGNRPETISGSHYVSAPLSSLNLSDRKNTRNFVNQTLPSIHSLIWHSQHGVYSLFRTPSALHEICPETSHIDI